MDDARQTRTLYCLRHTDATMALWDDTHLHTLSKQLGTSVKRLYSNLNVTMAAKSLA